MLSPRKPSLYRTITPTPKVRFSLFPLPQRTILKTIGRDAKERLVKQSVGCQAVNKTGFVVLFSGPTGTGKTLAAQILAKELLTKLVVTNCTRIKGRYIGETEKNLARVFDAASKRGAILFFDEADALFGKRTSVKESHTRYANQEVSYLLQRLDSYEGLVILCASNKRALRAPLNRRVKQVVLFPASPSKTETARTRLRSR